MRKYLKKSAFTFLILSGVLIIGTLVNKSTAQDAQADRTAAEEEAMKALMNQRKAITAKELNARESGLQNLGPAVDFKLQDIHQDMISLSSYRGKQNVLLFFWTTWCPFCENELRVLNDMYRSLTKDGFEVLAINVGEDPDKVINFTQDLRLAYRILMDKDASVSVSSYAVMGVPTYILVDKAGGIVFKNNYFPQKEYKELLSNEN